MGRCALVTGASRGIGLAIARRLASEGFDLTISARSPDRLEVVAEDLRRHGGLVESVAADLCVEEQVRALSRGVHSLDLLVLCAGTGSAGALDEYPIRRLDKQVAVNLRAPFLLVQELLPALRRAAEGNDNGARVVGIASLAGMVAEPDLAAYSATKAALISFCESITVAEGGERGISATAISPGYVDTDMSGWVHERIAPREMIRAEDIAEVVSALMRLSRWAAVPNIPITRPGPALWRA